DLRPCGTVRGIHRDQLRGQSNAKSQVPQPVWLPDNRAENRFGRDQWCVSSWQSRHLAVFVFCERATVMDPSSQLSRGMPNSGHFLSAPSRRTVLAAASDIGDQQVALILDLSAPQH